TYLKMMQANEQDLIVSAHDISDGGMLTALAECVIGTDFGAKVTIDNLGDLSTNAKLFAESHSRFIVSIKPENKEIFEMLFNDKVYYLGEVTKEISFKVIDNEINIINNKTAKLEDAWKVEL
ncbi:MAG: phosphoribosylformylglycinamidine synthase, partial [Chlorobi bacterium]|nr:phosphoribosylformylglycinamidine synthase [Chlorobiota bacterium]